MADAKLKILEAASKLFFEGGTHALSVRAISKQAGVSTIGIYSHFDGKQGILDALYIRGFELVAEAMTLEEEYELSSETVAVLVRRYLKNAIENEAYYKLIFGDHSAEYQPSNEAKDVAISAFSILVKHVGRLFPNNTDQQNREIAIEIWSITHGFVSLRHHVYPLLGDVNNWEDKAVDAAQTFFEALVAKRS